MPGFIFPIDPCESSTVHEDGEGQDQGPTRRNWDRRRRCGWEHREVLRGEAFLNSLGLHGLRQVTVSFRSLRSVHWRSSGRSSEEGDRTMKMLMLSSWILYASRHDSLDRSTTSIWTHLPILLSTDSSRSGPSVISRRRLHILSQILGSAQIWWRVFDHMNSVG